MSNAQTVCKIFNRRGQAPAPAFWALAAVALLLTGCASAPKPQAEPVDDQKPCQAAAQNDTWVGNWLGVNKRRGMAGELHVQMILRQDGTMAYTEQLKRAGKSPQSLRETGCWHRQGNELVMRTTHSNAVAVEPGDPIYTNAYTARNSGAHLMLSGPEGPFSLKRMPADFLLPVF